MALLIEAGCPLGGVDGIVMDLGASSMQMDSPERGFGLSRDSPLDMRMSWHRLVVHCACICPKLFVMIIIFRRARHRFLCCPLIICISKCLIPLICFKLIVFCLILLMD